ncbi:7911_t:CDS:2 [Gigaspora rosea]|nr:7911_t:CDS:2 [Gigaspora rosea]
MVPVYHNKQNINIDVTSYSVSPELNNAENNNNYIQDMGSVEQRLNQLQVVNQDDSSLNSENSFFMSV